MITTGDINLVHDPQVKTSLINYLGQLKAGMNEFYRGVSSFLSIHDDLLRGFELARSQDTDSGKDSLANELLSVQNDRTAAAIFRLLEKNIASRIWYLEQILAATEDLSDQLDPQSSH